MLPSAIVSEAMDLTPYVNEAVGGRWRVVARDVDLADIVASDGALDMEHHVD
mgnify:CR=1 FL=1